MIDCDVSARICWTRACLVNNHSQPWDKHSGRDLNRKTLAYKDKGEAASCLSEGHKEAEKYSRWIVEVIVDRIPERC